MEKAVVAFYKWWLSKYDNTLVILKPSKFAGEAFLAGVKYNDYAYDSVEEYEEYFGGEVNEAFRIGWNMARATNQQLGIKEEPLERDDFSEVLREADLFSNLEIDRIFFECKKTTYTLGAVLAACRKVDIGLDDSEITGLANKFINAKG